MITPGDLSDYGITDVDEIIYNPSYNMLFAEETKPGLSKYERGFITRTGAISVDTGIFTELSPKDRYIVLDDKSRDTIWWKSGTAKASENKPVTPDIWDHCKNISSKQFSGKRILVIDCFCGANEGARINARFITEIAWQAHFVKNIFIRPEPGELEDFKPDFVVMTASKAVNRDWKKQGLCSENFIIINLSENMAVIGGTWYGGEMKKCLFSVMNYYLTSKGIASLNCSANMGAKGDVALFLGLSGTGKTTLATDPGRMLIGDDAHGWDDEGIFSIEGGCYAKCNRLSWKNEPEIYDAIRRDALLENLVIMSDGTIDFNDDSKSENTRVSFPIYHINNIVKPASKAGHPKKIIFLSVDSFGVLPPVSRLTPEQAGYYFLSGYTSGVVRTERGIIEPVPFFSPCFCASSLLTDPVIIVNDLTDRMRQYGAEAWLVNTGWQGGPYGTGSRIELPATRHIIRVILDDSIKENGFMKLPVFNLSIPVKIRGIDDSIVDPARSWDSTIKWHIAATDLALKFINNFSKFTTNPETAGLAEHGPRFS